MISKIVKPWITVNEIMDDEYRATVIQLALGHWSEALPDLRQYANESLGHIAIPGFRSLFKAPVRTALPFVIREFKQKQSVASAIICLWSETQQNVINDLSIKTIEAGIELNPEWMWREAKTGYYDYDDIPKLYNLVNSIVEGKEKLFHDQYFLAMLWLSQAVIDLVDNGNEPTVQKLSESEQNNKESLSIESGSSELHSLRVETPTIDAPVLESNLDNDPTSSPIHEVKRTGGEYLFNESLANQSFEPQEMDEIGLFDIKNSSLINILSVMNEAAKKVDANRDSLLSVVQSLHVEVTQDKLATSQLLIQKLECDLAFWKASKDFFSKFTDEVWLRLQHEYEARPDLDQIFPQNPDSPISTLSTAAILEVGKNAIQTILEYDQNKQKIEENLMATIDEITKSQQAILIWSNEPESVLTSTFENDEASEYTLVDLENKLQQAEVIGKKLSARHKQYREQSINRIQANITKLKETPGYDAEIEVKGYSLATLFDDSLFELPDKDLVELEDAILALVNEQIAKIHRGSTSNFASKLKNQWDDQILAELLGCLANEKREVEAFLLEFASVKTHPRNAPNIYSKLTINNILNGLEQLSKSKPFEFLGWISPAFLTGFDSLNPQSRAEICMLALAANMAAEHMQPDNYLWQITSEWPIQEMPSWEKLWQKKLLEEPIQIFSDQNESILLSNLTSKRNEAKQFLMRDGGHFVRLSSLQSNRHRLLLSNKLMPFIEDKFKKLKEIENALDTCNLDNLTSLLSKSLQVFNLISTELEESALLKRYETGVYEDGIDDIERFHRKTSIRIFTECADSILSYGNALIEYWKLRDARSNGLNSEDLHKELSQLSELTIMGQAAFELVVQYQTKDRIVWDETYANKQSLQHLIRETLTRPSIFIHLPHLATKLVNGYLDWDAILSEVLCDIAEPLSPSSTAEYLLTENAPNQALMLVQHLTLDQQKYAQELRSKFEHQLNELRPKLLQLGGHIESVAQWHEIGRWGYLLGKVREDIAIQQEVQEIHAKAVADKSLEFRQRINNMDLELFKAKAELSTEVYQIAVQGIDAVKRASEMEDLFVVAEGFLNEMSYRLDHNSWRQNDLQVSVSSLEQAISKNIVQPEIQISVEELLAKLEEGQLEDLKLTQNQIADSEINTRIDLLHNWITVKQINGLERKNIHEIGVSAIQNVFRYFAQMISMKKFRGIEGKELAFTDPLVYEYWQLQYPRTAALDNACILIALPGTPPNIYDMKILQEFIESKDFLDDYFVLLFIPGCDEKAKKRFHNLGDGKGLVIIDDAALIRMVLAETDGKNPIGHLRPMMLDAINANTNIFSVNQTVDARTAIFLGRDRLIDNIVRSGGNFPIYGGRRIGKSSLLKAVEQKLSRKDVNVISYSLEGVRDLTDESVSRQLADRIGLKSVVDDTVEFKQALLEAFDNDPEKKLVIILDEIDRYIQVNKQRHIMIEALRAASDRYGNRFRIIIAGFMELYDCLSGRGPYTQTSDPWRRMLDNSGPLGNLTSTNAEAIVTQGFREILGWSFEHRSIPQLIVERTSGHPAFVQEFCLKILERVRGRGEGIIRISDIDSVFKDNDPKNSFIAYVRETLEMNLDPIGRYLVVMLAARPNESTTFTWDEICEIGEASNPPIPEDLLKRSLECLSVTSVVREVSKLVYEYTVPDYPNILNRLGDTSHFDELEEDLKNELRAQK